MSKRSKGICAVAVMVIACCAIFGATTALGDRGAAHGARAAGNPHALAARGNPHAPGTTGNPHALGAAGNPHALAARGNPHDPGTTGNPHAPGTTGNPHAPGTTGNPHDPGTAGNPHDPGTAGNPHTPGTTGNPHTPGTTGNPHAPGTTGNPHVGGGHGNPHAGATGTPGATGSTGPTGGTAGTGTGANNPGTGTGSNNPGTGTGANNPGTGTGSNNPGTGTGSNNPGTGTGSNNPGTGTGSSNPGTGTGSNNPGTGTSGGNTGTGTTQRVNTFLSRASLLQNAGPTAGGGIGTAIVPPAFGAASGGAFTLPLVPGLATATAISPGTVGVTTQPATTAVAADVGGSHTPHKQNTSAASVIERVVNVIPNVVWLAIGISLALAAIAGGAAVWSGRQIRRQAGEVAAISAAALTDSLTGVLNRRGFIDAVERELARAKRYGRQFVLAYVDVRGLKAVNDTEGHLAGDRLLQQAAQLLSDSARADDVVGRIGGDEMGVLLVEQGAGGAAAVTGRIASQVSERRRELGLRTDWDLTIGTATYPTDGETVNELLATADRRLYEQRGIALSS